MQEEEREVVSFLKVWEQLSIQQEQSISESRLKKWNEIVSPNNASNRILDARFELGIQSDLYRRSSTFPLSAVNNAPKIQPYRFTQTAGRKGILQAMQSSLKSERDSLYGKLKKAIIAMLQLLNISDLKEHLVRQLPREEYVQNLLNPAITTSDLNVVDPAFLKALDMVLKKLTEILSHVSSIREWIKNLSIAGLELGNDAGDSFLKPLGSLVAVQTRALDKDSYDIGLLNACMALGLCALPLPKRLLGPEIQQSQAKVSLPPSVESKWYPKGYEIDEVKISKFVEGQLPVGKSKWCQWTPLVMVQNSDKVTVVSKFDDLNIHHRRALEMATSTVLYIASQSNSLDTNQRLCALLLNLPHTINLSILGTQPTNTMKDWWAQAIYRELGTNIARKPPLLFYDRANIVLGASVGLRSKAAVESDATLTAKAGLNLAIEAANEARAEAEVDGDTPNQADAAARAAAAAVVVGAGVVAAANAAAAAKAAGDDAAAAAEAAAEAAADQAAAMVASENAQEFFLARCSVFKMDLSRINTEDVPATSYEGPSTIRHLSKISLADLYPRDYSKNLVDKVIELLHKLELNECEERAVKARLDEDEHTTVEPPEVEVTKRRRIVWDDATRTAAISGDRLYSFYRQLSGVAGESMNAVVQIDDSQYQRDLVRSREQATKLSTAASERFAGLIESTFAGLFRQSGLTFAIGDASQEVSIVSGNLRKQLTDLAQSEVGGLFQKSVELETLIESAKGKLTLTELVRQLTSIGDVLQRSTYMAAYNPTSTLSIETVAQPSNSLVLNVRDVATAAVNIAYDNLERELKYHYHRMRVPILYELVEGPDVSLSNAFATLCAHVMVQQRLHAGAAAAYVTKWSASINARMLGVALKRAVDAVCVYAGKYNDPLACNTRRKFFTPRNPT